MARIKTWALVTNGVLARILWGLEDGDSEDPIEIVSKAESTHLRDILTDKAGRSLASGDSGRRSAMEPGSDAILCDMQDFARETLSVLETHHRVGRFTSLAVLAAPKMLGVLRQEMPSTLRKSIVLEKDVNLINLPEADFRDVVLNAIGKDTLT